MALDVYATLHGINKKFSDLLIPNGDYSDRGNKNIRSFGFVISKVYSDPKITDSDKAVINTSILKVIKKRYKMLDNAIDYCHSQYKKNDLPVMEYTIEAMKECSQYFPDKDKSEFVEVEILWDIDVVWRTVEIISMSQYVYSMTKELRAKKLLSSRKEKNFLGRLYYRPFGEIFSVSRQNINKLRPEQPS